MSKRREQKSADGNRSARTVDGAVASAAFTEFDGGASAADVVKKLRVMPEDARRLQSDWAELTGVVVLSGRALFKVREIVESFDEHEGDYELRSADDLLRYLEHTKRPKCATCAGAPMFCKQCFKWRPQAARDLLENSEVEARARQPAKREEYIEQGILQQARDQCGRRGVTRGDVPAAAMTAATTDVSLGDGAVRSLPKPGAPKKAG